MVLNSIEDIKRFIKNAKSKGNTVGFVPTMGFLHAGHLSLIERAKEENDIVILKFYMQPDQTMNFRIRILYRDFNNKSHIMQSVRMDMEGGELTYEAEGTKFILTKRR